MSVFSRLYHQVKAYPFTFFILILSSILSIGIITTTLHNINKTVEIENYLNQFQINNKISFNFEYSDKFELQATIDTLRHMSSSSNLVIQNMTVETEGGLFSPMIEYWNSSTYNKLPLLEGNAIPKEFLELGDKVCMVGQAFIPYLTKMNGKRYIKLDHENFEVIGIIGTEKGNSPYLEHRIVVPITSLTQRMMTSLQAQKNVSVELYGDPAQLIKDYDIIKSHAGEAFKLGQADFSSIKGGMSNFSQLGSLGNQFTFIMIVYVLALINCINIAIYWLKERRSEIAIKKAFGIRNMTIAFSLYSELFVVYMISAILIILLQLGLSGVIGKWIGYPYHITIADLINHSALVFITSLLVVILPITTSRNIQPVELMRKV
ncbi:ABC transporter permease [Paenibacillus aceris]|uniref:ABC transport system permease protein n=1 Tax=Paenibacillus aceris TaxID=869555 RepID=A0ABS4HZC3_9BACL|nr:ABC transporter permease [Paenibacillus aceris]MBP1963985.1 putative ABC transport system permease protein [Paenibacillus aceris]NHW34597.1 ABC transporter permease [Paenibacillus aceris]